MESTLCNSDAVYPFYVQSIHNKKHLFLCIIQIDCDADSLAYVEIYLGILPSGLLMLFATYFANRTR